MTAFVRSTFPVFNVLGYVVLMFAATMLVPLAFAVAAGDGSQRGFDIALLITVGSGLALMLTTRRFRRELQVRDGFLLVTLVWTVLPAFATLPLLMQMPDLSITDAYFEAMSGLTASGWHRAFRNRSAAVADQHLAPLDGVDRRHGNTGAGGSDSAAARCRRRAGVQGRDHGSAEGNKAHAAHRRHGEGFVCDLFCAVACVFSGLRMGRYELERRVHAHVLDCSGSADFHRTTRALRYWNSPLIEGVAVVFMTLAGFSFLLHFTVWRRKSLWPYWNSAEARAFMFTLAAAVLVVAAFLLVQNVYTDWQSALRYALFNVVSVATTTGYSNTDYNLWPVFAPILMLFLSGFATCAGSTGGGIKMMRALILLKQARREMVRILHPRLINPVCIDDKVVENNVIFAVLAFMLVYGGSIIWLTFLLLLSGLDVTTAFTAIVACVNNTGPGLNQVGPASNFGVLSDFQTWVCTFAMLIGRLELFAVSGASDA